MQRHGIILTSETVVVPARGFRSGRTSTSAHSTRGAVRRPTGALPTACRQVLRAQVIERAAWLVLAAGSLVGLVICFWG